MGRCLVEVAGAGEGECGRALPGAPAPGSTWRNRMGRSAFCQRLRWADLMVGAVPALPAGARVDRPGGGGFPAGPRRRAAVARGPAVVARPRRVRRRLRAAPAAAARAVRQRGGQPGCLCGQHHHGEGACIIDRPASRPLGLAYESSAPHPAHRPAGGRTGRCHAMTAIWLFLRAESRRRWRAWLSLALIVGVFAGGVVTAAAGALRTGSAYARFLDWSRAPDALVDADPYNPILPRPSPAAVMRVPQAADAAVIKSFGVTPGIVQFIAPASNAIPGGFWKRKILSGRLADPARPGEGNVSFPLAQRFHLRAGDPLRLVLTTAAGQPAALVFHVAGIDAAHAEFPPPPGNGGYIAWGPPAFYRQHRALGGFVQVALRFHHGSRDWPAVQRELNKNPSGKLVESTLLSAQSVNTQRSIHPQAVALWLLAAPL